MNLPEFAVRRPTTVFMLFGVVLLFGILGLSRLPVDLMPAFEVPMVSVVTLYPGAGSEDIESNVTEVLEDALSTISGVEHIDSVSQTGLSAVMVQFTWGTDLNEASSDVRDVLDMLSTQLPDDIEKPMLMKMSSTDIPILMFGVTAEESFDSLRYIMTKQIADPLKAVPGVASVMVLGGPEREIQVRIDPGKLEAMDIPLSQVTQVLAAENVDIPVGSVKLGWTEYSVRVPGRLVDVDQLDGIVVGQSRDGKLIHLGDVAEVRDSFAEQEMKARADRVPGVVFFVSKQSGSNSVTVAKAALKRLDELKAELPPDIKLFTFFDTSDYIGRALRNLRQALMYGALGVVAVVLLFLRRIRSTVVIGLTIPAALLASLFVMYVAGYSINMVSLMSLAIAIGMVVDAAIVVLENVTRHVEAGERVTEASMFAPAEIAQAITASTLTTIVVFLPMLFITNITGILFKQMALVVIVSISMSLFAALTLTPALSSTLMRGSFDGGEKKRRSAFFRRGEEVFKRLEERYAGLLSSALNHRKRTVWIAVGVFAVSMAMLGLVKTEFFPSPDSGEIEMTVELAPGTRLDRTMEVLGQIEDFIVREVPEREYLWSYAGATGSGYAVIQGEKEGSQVGRVGVQLVDKELRKRSSDEVAEDIRKFTKSIPAVVTLSIRTGSSMAQFMGMSGTPLSIQIKGENLQQIEQVAVQIRDAVRAVEGAVDVDLDIGDPKPEFHVVIDRERAAALGLNTYTIASALRSEIYGAEATKLRQGGDQWGIVVRVPEGDRSSVEDILALPVPSVTGQMVRLSSVAEVELATGPTEIKRRDQERVVRVEGRVLNRPLGQVSGDVRKAIDQMEFPKGVAVQFGGDVEQQAQSFHDLGLLLLLAVALVYMVMAAQFENLTDPFVVMFSIPFAFVGVIWAFVITNTTLSMTSFLAVIMLMGIVVNNAIVLVDYTNIMRKRGMRLEEAVLISGRRRLRPVLMTALTTIFGMLPLALMRSSGSEVWRPLGIAMVGGLLVSTMVTLVLVPTLYTIFEARLRRNARWSR